MDDVLHNPVYNALLTGDSKLALGKGQVRYFDSEVSPFAGFSHSYKQGFDELREQLPAGRRILYANPDKILPPRGWEILAIIEGLQFVHDGKMSEPETSIQLIPLTADHVDEMVVLAALTKPGPFGMRTIEFGNYHGVFVEGKLVAMTGQRLHAGNNSEISAVCTHPNHLGKGYAAALMRHQANWIIEHGQRPFLHVRADNERAIALYERLGFSVSRPMNFYFMKKSGG